MESFGVIEIYHKLPNIKQSHFSNWKNLKTLGGKVDKISKFELSL